MQADPVSSFRVLVFSKTTGYRHDSIPAGIAALRQLADASVSPTVSPAPFTVDASEDSSLFTPLNLARYHVLVLLQTSGNFLDSNQLESLQSFVRSGGGVVGVHCASCGMHDRSVDTTGWFGRLLGAQFSDHPAPQAGVIRAADVTHSIMAQGLGIPSMVRVGDGISTTEPARVWFDEWYNFQTTPRANNVNVLLTVDEASYHGGTMGNDHPIAWCQEFDGARTFYTALGHFDKAYKDDMFKAHLLSALLWTARIIN